MAEILTTKEIGVALDNIIKNAEKYICIFTYNINIDETYLSRLRNASKRGVKIIVVFGIDRGDQRVLDSLQAIPTCEIWFKQYLHAKFFYNEKELLIGSMNLSEISERRNYELAVLFNIKENAEIVKKVKAEAKEIIEDSVAWKLRSDNIDQQIEAAEKMMSAEQGCCIRCGTGINYDPGKPLCFACYQQWSEWENEYYLERYCHRCKKEKPDISFAKPQCKRCYAETLSDGFFF